jgi:putative flippase GtrA
MTTAGLVAPGRPLNARARTAHHELGHHAAWYVVAGVVSTGVQSVLFVVLQPPVGSQLANLVAIGLTTIGNTEFHRRVTFAGRQSEPGKRHLQDFLTFLFYAGYGSIVLASLDAVVGNPSVWMETVVLFAASGVGGVARFVVLRWWVFADRH